MALMATQKNQLQISETSQNNFITVLPWEVLME